MSFVLALWYIHIPRTKKPRYQFCYNILTTNVFPRKKKTILLILVGLFFCLACHIPAAYRGSYFSSNAKHSYHRQRLPRYCHKVPQHFAGLDCSMHLEVPCLTLPVKFDTALTPKFLKFKCRFLLHRLSLSFPDLPILALVDWYDCFLSDIRKFRYYLAYVMKDNILLLPFSNPFTMLLIVFISVSISPL